MPLTYRVALLLLLAPTAVLARPSPLAGSWMCASTPPCAPIPGDAGPAIRC